MNQRRNGKEVHLFILWEKARSEESRILNDIKTRFSVLDIYRSAWSDQYFSENLSRFYGESLPDRSFKERHCGRGEFLAVIVEDTKPEYGYRGTSKGPALVNTHMFDAKELYRSWTRGGHKVHATNDLSETRHDLALLLGLEAEIYLGDEYECERNPEVKRLNDLVGAQTWSSIRELFYVLNQTSNYVVLRNFECLPDHYTMKDHGDIDLLVDDYDAVSYLTNAKRVFRARSRVLNKVNIRNEEVLFDFRFLGDDYFDLGWQKDVLDNRVLSDGGFYRPDPHNYFYSLLYHALVHKKKVSRDYKERLVSLAEGVPSVDFEQDDFGVPSKASNVLSGFLESKGYMYTPPLDLSVYYNRKKGWWLRLSRVANAIAFNIRRAWAPTLTPRKIYLGAKEALLRRLCRLGA